MEPLRIECALRPAMQEAFRGPQTERAHRLLASRKDVKAGSSAHAFDCVTLPAALAEGAFADIVGGHHGITPGGKAMHVEERLQRVRCIREFVSRVGQQRQIRRYLVE